MKETANLYDIKRYDSSNDRSLRAHSAADEYLLQEINQEINESSKLAIYHDRFGYLSCHLKAHQPTVILTSKSQQISIEQNHQANDLPPASFSTPLTTLDHKIDIAIIKIPKSIALFELFLQQISQNATSETKVICAFMTRHFSPRLIEIGEKYFENTNQSKAVKKARLLTLSKPKKVDKSDCLDTIVYNDQSYKQYWGVFSAKHIDYATQYFLEHLEVTTDDKTILDLASGNGVIAKEIQLKYPNASIHLMDDFYLAVESAKLNIQGDNIHHHYDNKMSHFADETFDLIATNPPFHIEYETNINIPIQLFKECFRCLKPNGNLQIVANKHLNYLTHLKSIFNNIEVVADNEKFIVYKCVKTSE